MIADVHHGRLFTQRAETQSVHAPPRRDFSEPGDRTCHPRHPLPLAHRSGCTTFPPNCLRRSTEPPTTQDACTAQRSSAVNAPFTRCEIEFTQVATPPPLAPPPLYSDGQQSQLQPTHACFCGSHGKPLSTTLKSPAVLKAASGTPVPQPRAFMTGGIEAQLDQTVRAK